MDKIYHNSIKDLFYIKPKIFEDTRGYFFESYNKSFLKEFNFVQDNESKSKYGVLRGIHYLEQN